MAAATLHRLPSSAGVPLKCRHAYDTLRREIVSYRMLPGTRFTELEIMDRYGLGKASCRIALQRLSQDGFVCSMPRHGYRVSPVTIRDVDEVFALRLVLEPCAADRRSIADWGQCT